MRSFSTGCTSCGQSGPRRPSAPEARAAFRGHRCGGVRQVRSSADEDTLRVASRAARLVLRGRRVSPHDFEECVSDALFGIASAEKRFDPTLSTWASYALASGINAVRDGLRRRLPLTRAELARGVTNADDLPPWRRPTLSIDEIRTDMPSWDVADPAGDVDFRAVENRDLVARLLAVVHGREREVLELYYLHGLNGREIGDLWGCTESWAALLKKRALAAIRDALPLEDAWGDRVSAVAALQSWEVERAA